MTFKLINNLTKKEYTFGDIVDKSDSRLFWHFDLTLDGGMGDGEYTYTLLNEEGVIEGEGILQIGDYTQNKKNYKTEKKTYKVYGE